MDWFNVTDDWLRARSSASPDVTALIVDGRVLTFEELDCLVNQTCNYLIGIGVSCGEHIGVLMSNSLAAVCCIFAVSRLGAVLVPLNIRLTAEEIAWQVNRADCARVIVSFSMQQVAEQATQGKIPAHGLAHNALAFEKSLAGQPHNFEQSVSRYTDSLQAIAFTSGTTGFPKGAMITYANHYWSAKGSASRLGTVPEDRWLACLPLYHVGGLAILFRSCLLGTTVVLHDGFDTRKVRESLRTEGITIVSLVPTMLGRLLREGLNQASALSLRLILLGGSASPPKLLAEANAAGLPVAVTYGLTEATSQVATMLPTGVLAKPGSPGKPLPSLSISILDEDDEDLPAGAPGEIAVAGPTIFAGYYGDPRATKECLRAGWLHTGDVGYLDNEGDLWVLDRRSDLIVSGGENVYPAEIERVLRDHPSVGEVCVVGMPHQDWGQQVTALIIPTEIGNPSESEILAFSRDRLAGYKRPRAIFFVNQLPQTGSGKVNRRVAADELARMLGTK